jgi:signal transduction histidine kinase
VSSKKRGVVKYKYMSFFGKKNPGISGAAPSPHPRAVPPPAGDEAAELRSIIASMQDGLIVYDQNFAVSLFNAAAEKIFGMKKEAVIGQTVGPQQAQDPLLQRLVQTLFPTLAPTMVPRSKSGEYPQVVDISFESPTLELRTITAPLADASGHVTGFMKIIRDRTHEIALAKAKTEFITVASHQLRTPTTNIEWTLEALAGIANLDENSKTLLANAQVSAKQLKTVVEDLLNISRIEEGRFGYALEDADLTAFIQKILGEILPQARRLGISLYFDPPVQPLPPVHIDQKKLSMAFTNLVDNAIRYNVANGSVTVALQKQADKPYIEVTIKDTGIGVPAEDAQKLFSKFFRASNAVKTRADGSGLGLYITQNIIQAHGGSIWLESELNRGSTFHFTIPTDFSLIPPKEVAME